MLVLAYLNKINWAKYMDLFLDILKHIRMDTKQITQYISIIFKS